ncbi:MAG: glycosyltransferase family 39 protein [Halieaceae bacterium]|nr:glycosyltransferase family 39 protein [Halieaceae bacterium]
MYRKGQLIALLLAAVVLLGLGIWEHTGITEKDEYYLGLRTPMCMQEQDRWLVPCLDNEPRLKKPPMLYWLTRGSYEIFGVSITSARLVAVSLAMLAIVTTALIAIELTASITLATLAGLIALSFLGMGVGGRMLGLDVAVATFSALSFYALLRWYRRDEVAALVLAAIFLAMGFLTKGPVVAVVCGAGGLALLATDPGARRFVARRWKAALAAVFLFFLLALPWFLYVQQLYPALSAQELSTELGARNFLQLSPVPLYGILLLSLPWSFVLLATPSGLPRLTAEDRQRARMLAIWLALTLLPFFFFKTFERYLFGSLVPTAILLALLLRPPLPTVQRWAARAGLVLSLLLAVVLLGAAYWLGGAVLALLAAIIPLAWFTRSWWQARQPLHMALSAALLWGILLGLVYPQLGINRIPPHIVEQARGQAVALYHGPQPALLPGVLARSLVHLDGRWRLPQEMRRACARFLLFTPAHEAAKARDGLEQRAYQVRELERFGVLSSRVAWYRMGRKGLTREQAWEALKRRDIEAIKPQVVMFEVENTACIRG